MEMTRNEQFERNLAFFTEFNLFLLEHPEYEDQIPDQVVIVYLPDNDPELREANRIVAEKRRRDGEQVLIVRTGPLELFRLGKAEPTLELVAA